MHTKRPRYQRYCFNCPPQSNARCRWTFKIRPFDTADFNTLALTDYLSLPESLWETIVQFCPGTV